MSKHPVAWISDEVVNAYAGGAYIMGVSPIFIGADTPPLGRYFIGISTLIFNNENEINLFFAIGSLVMMYILARRICSTVFAALAPVAFFSSEIIFRNQLLYTPLLDIMQLLVLLCFFYVFMLGFETKKRKYFYFALASFFLGMFISIKFFATGVTLVAATVILLVIYKKFSQFVDYLITLPIAVGVLLGSYLDTLFSGTKLSHFLGIQKWVFLYHKSQLILPFSIWALLLLNKWYVWWGATPVIHDTQWQVTWPIITVGTVLTGILILSKKIPRSPWVELLLLWSGCYLLFFSFGQIASRYFVILLPVFYICNSYMIEKVVAKVLKKIL
ncbi:MAG TPA: glycosyltransferase family 39 protein [Patescibacteria group bacterium]|nr:glycosyltransferase family 39 protein [Patescibacteria group bacterium]